MTGQARNFNLKAGKHTGIADFTSTPGTMIQLAPEGTPGFRPLERMKIVRGAQTAGARLLHSIVGPIELAPQSLEQVLRGMSGNTGGAVDAEAASEVGIILDSLFGADSIDPSGSGATVAGGNGSTPTLILSSATNFSVGMAVLFPTSTGTYIREIVSIATDTLTLDRDYPGTPVNGTVVYRGPHWLHDTSIIQHTPLLFDAEGEDYRGTFYGCTGTGKLSFSAGDYVRLLTEWHPTNFARATQANPTYTEATAGNAGIPINAFFYSGDASYTVTNLAIELGGEVRPRRAQNGVQGVHGHGIFNKEAKITGTFYLGDDSSLGDIDDGSTALNAALIQGTSLSAGDSNPPKDIAIQVGSSPGAAMYIRAPAGEFSAKPTTVDGYDAYNFTVTCKSPTTGSPFRLHLF